MSAHARKFAGSSPAPGKKMEIQLLHLQLLHLKYVVFRLEIEIQLLHLP